MNTEEPLSPADRALPAARDPLIHYVPVLALLCAITLSLYYHRWLRTRVVMCCKCCASGSEPARAPTSVPKRRRAHNQPPKIGIRIVQPSSTISPLIDESGLQVIAPRLPTRCRAAEARCIFATGVDGYDIESLYRAAQSATDLILVFRDSNDGLFGAFIAASWPHTMGATYFGSGEAFLFKIRPDTGVYSWTHRNRSFVVAQQDGLGIGGGGSGFGLWVDGSLNHGTSKHCDTFDNPSLCAEGDMFQCIAAQVWALQTAGDRSGDKGKAMSAMSRLARRMKLKIKATAMRASQTSAVEKRGIPQYADEAKGLLADEQV